MELSKLQGAIEAILFSSGSAVSVDRLAQSLQSDRATVIAVVGKIRDKFEDEGSGIRLLEIEDGYQLASKHEYAEEVKHALEIKRNTPLSQAALEVLAIIAYNQPVTRAFVEQVRGVDSSGVVVTLVEKDLVEESGRMDLPGRPIAYRTTDNFLRCFALSSLSDLPPLPKDEQDDSDDIDDDGIEIIKHDETESEEFGELL